MKRDKRSIGVGRKAITAKRVSKSIVTSLKAMKIYISTNGGVTLGVAGRLDEVASKVVDMLT